MTDRDTFAEGREAAEELRRTLEAVREDVRAVVREEVADAGLPESELRRLVSEMVRRELAAATPRTPRWRTPAFVALGVVLGLLGGALGYRALAGTFGGPEGDGAGPPPAAATGGDAGAAVGAGATDADTAVPGGAGAPAGASDAPDGPTTPAVRAARFDSLFASGSPALEPLLADLEGAAAAPVLEALAAWRTDPALDPAPRRRLHDALVQAAVNRLGGAALALDGLVTRGPCGGASCGAVLRLWEGRGPEWGLPAYPADPAAREAALPVVERILVLRGVEAAGG